MTQELIEWCFAPLSTIFNPFPNKPWFLCICSTSLLKTLWEQKKLLITSNFSYSHSVFQLFGELSTIFIEFKNCCRQTLSVWKGLKFAIWEWVKSYHCNSSYCSCLSWILPVLDWGSEVSCPRTLPRSPKDPVRLEPRNP